MLRACLLVLFVGLPAALLQAPPVLAQSAAAHPSQMLVQAGELFEQGSRDEATFWFYLVQRTNSK